MSEPRASRTSRRLPVAASVVVVILIVAAGLLFLRHASPSRAAAGDTLTVGDQRGGAQALLAAAGELDNLPYRIDWAVFPAAAPLLEALSAGAVDVGGVGGAPFAFAYASGAHIRAVYAYRAADGAGRASAVIVRRDSPLRTVADLKGKKVATIRGSAGQNLVLRLLEQAGLKASDVEWVYLANGESKAALGTGAIDAWSTWGSYVGIALLEDGDRVLADGTGLSKDVGFFAANDGALTAKRAILADFVQRLSRAKTWAQQHPRDYAAVLARETGLPFRVALFAITSNLGSTVPIDDRLVAEQVRIFERYRRAGVIAAVPDLRGGYDPIFNRGSEPAVR